MCVLSFLSPCVCMYVCVCGEGVNEVREGMSGCDSARLELLRSSENLIGQISGTNADKVNEVIEEVKRKWAELQTCLDTRTRGESHIFQSQIFSNQKILSLKFSKSNFLQ